MRGLCKPRSTGARPSAQMRLNKCGLLYKLANGKAARPTITATAKPRRTPSVKAVSMCAGARLGIRMSAIDTGNSVPVYATFEFTQIPVWIQVPEAKVNQLKVFVSDITLLNETTSPKLNATIKNDSLFIIPNLNVVAILYNVSGNAIDVSQTYLDTLDPGEIKALSFTWPEPITDRVIAEELIPLYNIFSVRLK